MFSRGAHTLHVSAQLFCKNRQRLVEALKGKTCEKSVVILRGGVEKMDYNGDTTDLPFKQVSLSSGNF